MDWDIQDTLIGEDDWGVPNYRAALNPKRQSLTSKFRPASARKGILSPNGSVRAWKHGLTGGWLSVLKSGGKWVTVGVYATEAEALRVAHERGAQGWTPEKRRNVGQSADERCLVMIEADARQAPRYGSERELALRMAVLQNAIDDACGAWTTKANAENGLDALRWIRGEYRSEEGWDFESVCAALAYDASAVREAVLAKAAPNLTRHEDLDFEAMNESVAHAETWAA